MECDIDRRFLDASKLLASVRDIIDERVRGGALPSWCARREWVNWLAALSDDQVRAIERDGLFAQLDRLSSVPEDLAILTREAARCVSLPVMSPSTSANVDTHRTPPRKREQVASFASLVERLPRRPQRIVDIGSGHGHLTRHLARALGVPAEGWERDPARVAVAASLTSYDGPRFVTIDARTVGTSLSRNDLVVGLHACGELGDHSVRAASEARASVAIIGCCLQKRVGDRDALSVPAGIEPSSLCIGRAELGLGNACDGEEGVEADLDTRIRSRVNRAALRAILRGCGHDVRPGQEMRGVNRRRATGTLSDLVLRVFESRGLIPPSSETIDEADRVARADYAGTSRWTIPRTMLARLIEVWVALDRAAFLRANGYDAEVLIAFGADVSPRNIAILATPG